MIKMILSSLTVLLIAVSLHPAMAATATALVRPKVRIGLYQTNEPITVLVNAQSTVRTVSASIADLPSGTIVTLSFDAITASYSIMVNDVVFTTTEPVRVVPNKKNKVSTITSYANPPAWNLELNDNQFYGTIELNAGWVVNELGIENYLKGIAEASNDNPDAYLKALYTAARTYAYFQYLYPTKHAGEPYLLDATANDQVYRGYGMTSRSPNVVAAVEATAGQVVTYQGEVVVTPYFSQSDGRTRAWSEVWSGDYIYLQSVADPGCAGEELLGHGVGMSAAGARYFANEQSWHWKEILQYYYQDVALQQLW